MKFYTSLFFLLNIAVVQSYATTDSIIFKNNNYIVGEIKSLEKGIITVETAYSDADFTIEWEGIKEIHSETFFLITLTSGERYNGTIHTSLPGKVILKTNENIDIEVSIIEVVFLESIDQGFRSRIYASIDFGFELTKAQNLRSFSTRGNLGYLAERWSSNGTFSVLNSQQDSIKPIRRNDGSVDFRYYLPGDWFAVVSSTFLSNTEQQIKLRTTANLGLGKFLVHTNKMLWSVAIGTSLNNEQFEESANDRQSMEGFLSTELNMFNFDDISLLTKVVVIPSFTEANRWRTDLNFDFKYDLPYDLYIKTGVTFNYDNKPVEGASQTDYIIRTGVGWEW